MLYVKTSLQIIAIFALATALAYSFGFFALFAHTAFEAVYWGGYYLGTVLVGLFCINKLLTIKPIDIVKA